MAQRAGSIISTYVCGHYFSNDIAFGWSRFRDLFWLVPSRYLRVFLGGKIGDEGESGARGVITPRALHSI